MYDWVTHMHSHLGGKCPHKCSYCYVQKNRFGVSPRYQGKARFLEHELKVDYGKGNVIFIEHMNDMFAEGIFDTWILYILGHCILYSNNTYVFQTKNPKRAYQFINQFPEKFMIGTTIESNRFYIDISKAPAPVARYEGIKNFSRVEQFITIEPILDFDVDILVAWLVDINPSFVNIGADSKNCNLPEPPKEKIQELIRQLQKYNVTIKKKVNLGRLISL